MIAAHTVSQINDLAAQYAEAQAQMILEIPRGGPDAKKAKEVLAYVVTQLAFTVILEIKGR